MHKMSNTKLLSVTITNSNDQPLTLRTVKVKRENIQIKWIASGILAVIIVVMLIGLTTFDHQQQSDHHVLLPHDELTVNGMYDNQSDYKQEKILLIGGMGNQEFMEYFYPDDPQKNTLLNVTLITPRSGHTSVLFNETTVLTIGGRSKTTWVGNDYKWEDLRSTEIFNLLTNETYPFTDLSVTRLCYPGAAVLNGTIYVCGGCEGSTGWLDTALDSCELLNSENNTSTKMANMINKRAFFRFISHDDFLYAIGGQTGFDSASDYTNSMERYNIVEKKWHMVAPMIVQRAGLAATILNHTIYACGGISGIEGYRDITETSCEKYNIQNNSWQPISSMGEKRSDFVLLAFRSKLIAIGGQFDRNRAEIYDPAIDKWTRLPNKTIMGRYSSSGVVL